MPSFTPPTASGDSGDAGNLTVRTLDGIATIQFGHPKGNSLPGSLLRRMAESIDVVGADPSARVIVLRSGGTPGGPFCAGASFEELRRIADAAAGKEFFMGFGRLILAMRRCPKFIIARVHGKAVGGGVGVVAAADYAIASPGALVRLSELAVGIGPFVVGPVIQRKIGRGAFQALAVDAANWRDAAWAERHGLFAQVAGEGDALDAAVSGLAHGLAKSSPEAMARMKETFWQGTESWEELLDARAAMSGALVLSDYTRSAIAAFAAR
jgi:methylglutaconyl-CoA hydratase